MQEGALLAVARAAPDMLVAHNWENALETKLFRAWQKGDAALADTRAGRGAWNNYALRAALAAMLFARCAVW